jgi:SAM-dependent methyltransferase
MTAPADDGLPGVIPSPNIWHWPDVYELENRGVDPDRVIEGAMRAVHDWSGTHLLDVGCGSGFHLPRFAERAARVTGVEPHPPLLEAARRRVAALDQPVRDRVAVLEGSAERLPLPDASVDVVHARWAYFFGPGSEPGLAELRRVVRPGGTAFVVDNDATRSTFGSWFRRALPSYDPDAVRRFWRRQGFTRVPLDIRWEMPDRPTFARVVKIEFSAAMADTILAEHPGTSVDYAVDLWWRRY